MLLLKIQLSSGRKHQCDARCYNAKAGSQCHCQCCSGKNHGAGEQKALANMQNIYAQGVEGGLPEGAEIIKVPDAVAYIQQTLPIPPANDYGRIIDWPIPATNLSTQITSGTPLTFPSQLTMHFS